jgi:hypothetical protein
MNINSFDNIDYKIKIQLSAIIVIIVFILLFAFSPAFIKPEPVPFLFNEQIITFEVIDITIQQQMPAQPVRPRLSLQVSDDVLIDDPDLIDFLDIPLLTDVTMLQLPEASFAGTPVTQNPQRPPRVSRIVEPITPPGVIEDNLRIELAVTFLINPDGSIDELYITEIRVLDRQTGLYRETVTVGNQVIEATIQAARQWQFRPATDNGKPVKAYSTHVFIIGR